MPKRVEKWACAICGYEHADEEKAIECEASHFECEMVRHDHNLPEEGYPKYVQVEMDFYPLKRVRAIYEFKKVDAVLPKFPLVIIDELGVFGDKDSFFPSSVDVMREFNIPLKNWNETIILYVESGVRQTRDGEKGYVFGLFEKDGEPFILEFTFPKDSQPRHYADYEPVETSIEWELQELDGNFPNRFVQHKEKYRALLEKLKAEGAE